MGWPLVNQTGQFMNDIVQEDAQLILKGRSRFFARLRRFPIPFSLAGLSSDDFGRQVQGT